VDDSEIAEHRYRFFAEKSVDLLLEYDKILVTVFSAIIAGILTLLVSKTVGVVSSILFILANLSAAVGMAMCLLHMVFAAKVLGLFSAHFAGEENVPSLVSCDEPTQTALNRNRVLAQVCFAGQFNCLFWAVVFSALGVVALAWSVIGWTGLILGVLFTTTLVYAVGYPILMVYKLASARPPHPNPLPRSGGEGTGKCKDSR